MAEISGSLSGSSVLSGSLTFSSSIANTHRVSSGVNFYDYDGEIVRSYSSEEAILLSSLPRNPLHNGLVSQGWNWTLEDIKSYLTNYPNSIVNVGQIYTTDDGKTRIYVQLDDIRKSPWLQVCVNGYVIVDWGDNTSSTRITGTSLSTVVGAQHVYANSGNYVITLTVNGTVSFQGSSDYSYLLQTSSGTEDRFRSNVYRNTIQKIEIGDNVEIGDYAFSYMCSLRTITIPNGVTNIGNHAFQNCCSFKNVNIPNSVISIGYSAFSNCDSLMNVSIPDDISTIWNDAFNECYSLSYMTIPRGITQISKGMLQGCYSLLKIIMPDNITSIENYGVEICYSLKYAELSNNLTNIGNYAFYNCFSLIDVDIPSGVTNIGSYAFHGCYSINNVIIPDSVTRIGSYAFQSCNSLKNFVFSNNITTIDSYLLASCSSVTTITIPSNVTTIIGNSFGYCYGMKEYHFLRTTPPTLSHANAFSSIASDCIMYVPTGCLEAYQTANNWSTYASYMREE